MERQPLPKQLMHDAHDDEEDEQQQRHIAPVADGCV